MGAIYDLLEDMLTGKTNIDYVNADQLRFIVYLMIGYYDNDLLIKKH